MQLVKPLSSDSWLILNQILPGRADFLMHKTAHDRMEAVATYLAQQIKVKNKSLFQKFSKILFEVQVLYTLKG